MNKKIVQTEELIKYFHTDEILKYYKVEKIINAIKDKASKKFEELASFGQIKPSTKYYTKSKEFFIKIILNQCSKDNLLNTVEIVPSNSLLGLIILGLAQMDGLTLNKKIDEIIDAYASPIKIFLFLSDNKNIKNLRGLTSIFTKISDAYEEDISELRNKNRIYIIELFKKAKIIYHENKGKRPRVTQADSLVLANNELHLYSNEDLRDKNGFDTDFFISMQNSFRKQHKYIK